MTRLTDMGAERAKTDGAPIRRAKGNLRAVLQNRLTADDVTSDTLHDMAVLIDEAGGRSSGCRGAALAVGHQA